jgi:hypothetical protein
MSASNRPVNRWFELGALFLALLDVYLSFVSGRLLGFRGAELAGYSTGPLVTALIVVGISRLFKRTRTRQASAKIAFFTLLIFLFGTLSSLASSRTPQSLLTIELDPESFVVDDAKAINLGSQIQDSVSKGQTDNLKALYDADRFVTRALRGQDANSTYLQDVARGGSKSFAQNQVLEQMATLVARVANSAL